MSTYISSLLRLMIVPFPHVSDDLIFIFYAYEIHGFYLIYHRILLLTGERFNTFNLFSNAVTMSSINICCNSVESSLISFPKTAAILASSSQRSFISTVSFKEFPPVLLFTDMPSAFNCLMKTEYES
jgi:hypothetical protein